MLDVNSHFLTIGHRGCAGLEPENTLRSVRRAVELGCKMVEVDVHVVDGELVVIHDFSVDRTTNGKGEVEDYTMTDLRELDAGLGERIPLLGEVLDLCFMAGVAVNIEIKGLACVGSLVSLMKERLLPEIVISSFDLPQLEEFRSKCDHIQIAVLVDKSSQLDRAFDLAQRLSAVAINPSLKILDRSLVERAHVLGLKVYSYTVKTVGDYDRVLESGADGCFADDPRMVLERS
ncbi:glycerophosphodiester phosphodiesterase [Rubritalea sp.]|uniref:glycerophosphodiester phosphodiesterase n=1 Tax=Rubritalea sp. TaxID=2109375 RepID=UPI003EFB0831